MEKKCSKCKKVKASTDFYTDKRTTSGLYSSCKDCHPRSNSPKKKYKERPSEAEILKDYIEIREDGIFDKKQNKYLKIRMVQGYEHVHIRVFKGNHKAYKVHRLIAEKYIPKIGGKNYVNHKNGIKNDNRVENLEWCTVSENAKHSWDIGLSKSSDKHKLTTSLLGRKNGADNLKKARAVMKEIRASKKSNH